MGRFVVVLLTLACLAVPLAAQTPGGTASCPACQEAMRAADGVHQEIQTLAPQLAQLEQLSPQAQSLRQRLLVLEQRLTSLHRACAAVCGVPAPALSGP